MRKRKMVRLACRLNAPLVRIASAVNVTLAENGGLLMISPFHTNTKTIELKYKQAQVRGFFFLALTSTLQGMMVLPLLDQSQNKLK